jgi:hypothetical protein
MKKFSKYEQKLARRRRGGVIHYSLPVDRNGLATLNGREIVKERAFARLRRFDEIVPA